MIKEEFEDTLSFERDKDIYSEEGIDDCFENDGLSANEEAFLLGYLEAWKNVIQTKNKIPWLEWLSTKS